MRRGVFGGVQRFARVALLKLYRVHAAKRKRSLDHFFGNSDLIFVTTIDFGYDLYNAHMNRILWVGAVLTNCGRLGLFHPYRSLSKTGMIAGEHWNINIRFPMSALASWLTPRFQGNDLARFLRAARRQARITVNHRLRQRAGADQQGAVLLGASSAGLVAVYPAGQAYPKRFCRKL